VTKTNGPGPLHRVPRPFHLGNLASPEVDADVGPDADGRNNLNTRSAPFAANLDREDDGVRPEQLSFVACAASTIPITIAIGPGAALLLTPTQGLGYLNVWIDGNADGDWADSVTCSNTAGQTIQAHEHIVIDHPVNVNALGPGLHRVFVPTQRVPWSAPVAAWLRVSLSDRPSVKNLTTHGDGRGPVGGFGTGETEDYLWRNPQSRGPDMQVSKRGAFKLGADGTPTVAWLIEYENVGDAPATGSRLTDNLLQAGALPPTKVDYGRAAPPLATSSGYVFLLPTLDPGEGGTVIIEQALDGRLQYTNLATVTMTGDTFAGNDSAMAVLADVAVPPPQIVSPGNGTTCENEVQVAGRAEPGATVHVYVDGVEVGSDVASASGRFSVTVGSLTDGAHSIHAVAELGSARSGPSRSVLVVVDSSLGWSPISLRFIDSSGRVSIPRDSSGRTDETGWGVHLLSGERYTVSVKLCCAETTFALVSLSMSGTLVSMVDPDSDSVFQGVFTNTLPPGDLSAVSLIVHCGGVGISHGDGSMLIDPDGVVYDITTGALLPTSQVTCLAKNEVPSGSAASFEVWPAALYENQINPQVVGSDAHFAFFTPVGTYRLDAQKAGYQRYLSPDLQVISEPVRFDVPLTPIQSAPHYTVTISANGHEPPVLRMPKGSVVTFQNIDDTPHSATTPKSAPLNGKRYNFDSGLLQPGDAYRFKFDNPATYNYSDYNSTSSAVIIVEQPMQYLPMVTR
jgi:plastocyanin